MTVRAYAPASIGNFAAGFDVLGAALAPSDGSLWGDIVEAEECSGSESVELTIQGPYASALPQRAHDNLVVVCYDLFRDQMRLQGKSVPSVRLGLTKNLPLCSGLGSSSSSIVATLVALNELLGNPLDRQLLLELAAKAEGRFSGASHYDNVAPCLMGGLRLITGGLFPAVPSSSLSEELPFFEHWYIAVVHPELSVPTEKARAVIPILVPVKAAVHYWGNLAAFVHALHSHNEALAGMAIRDLLIEAYRQDLVPGFIEAKRGALDAGAIGCSLSGSGPSVFAVAKNETLASAAICAMQSAFDKRGTSSQAKICQLDTQGARILDATT